jgi:hypothetical protein
VCRVALWCVLLCCVALCILQVDGFINSKQSRLELSHPKDNVNVILLCVGTICS